ncbi:MAG: HAMP domain-containing sensor histidine kinase [bacterium]|nr:HAMP domain-containing histidine kinase [Myxococcales bacterium]
MVTRKVSHPWPTYTATGVAIAITIALLVGWVLVVVFYTDAIWLLVLGILGLVGVALTLGVLLAHLAVRTGELRRQRVFLDAMTHELKSPLASLKACAETLHRPDLPPEKRAPLLEMMGQDIDRLGGLIDDVLSAGRLADGRFGRSHDRVTLAEPAARAAERVARRHGVPAGAIVVSVHPGCAIKADPTAVETVLLNLIDNAVKYSDPPVWVRVAGTLDDETVVLTVTDHGIGIAPSDRRRILERFTRGDTDAVRSRHGSGLGLTVAAALIRRSKGRLVIDSPGLGHGTTVTVRWPHA